MVDSSEMFHFQLGVFRVENNIRIKKMISELVLILPRMTCLFHLFLSIVVFKCELVESGLPEAKNVRDDTLFVSYF